jgi:ATP-dependent helicase/DNAse subunit B
MNVLNQKSEPGYIHITSIDKAICSIRDNLYIAGLSSTKYPGSPKENYLLLDTDIDLFGDDVDYLTSKGRIKKKREMLITLAELASNLGSKIYLSYSGLNVSELKKDNASSMIFELYGKANGGSATAKDLEKATIKIDYFEPAISTSRLIGSAYVDEKCIKHQELKYDFPEIGWNIDKEYSPTAIEKFMGCPRSFMFGYILGVPEPDDNDVFEIISARDSGTLAHSLMEQLADNEMELEEFLKLSGEFFDRFIAQHPSLITDKVPAERDSFLEMMEKAYETDPRRKVILKEEDIHCTHESGVKLYGFPDRVEELEDGSLLIVDFKTGRNVNHHEDDIDTCLQVVIYAYLMERKGYKVSGGEFRYIRLGKTVTCKYDDEMKAKLSEKLELFKDMMFSGKFPCGMACDFCKYDSICGRSYETEFFGFDVEPLTDDSGEDSV